MAGSDHSLFGGPGQSAHELSAVPELLERTRGVVVADRNYWSPPLREELAGRGVELAASYRTKKHDPNPKRSAYLSRLRYRIDTVFSQLTERYSTKEGMGQGSLACERQAASEGLESHCCLPTQPPNGKPTPPALEATHLKNAHIG